jgi:hypothetical protein
LYFGLIVLRLSVDRNLNVGRPIVQKISAIFRLRIIGRPISLNGRPTVQIFVDFCTRVSDRSTDPPKRSTDTSRETRLQFALYLHFWITFKFDFDSL